MAEVGRDPLVIVVGRHLLPTVPIVPGGVVHQHGRRAKYGLEGREGVLELVDVAKITGLKADFRALAAQLVRERPATLGVEVNEPGP